MISPLRPSNFRTSEACSSNSRSRLSGFTLLELILVIAIIAVLASLLIPAIGTAQQHAYSVSCSSNLRAIGVATQCYLQDHGFLFPCIEPLPDSSSNVYPANFQPTPYTCMGGTNGAFGPYGITQQMTQCPTDYKSPNHGSHGAYGSSYDWKPTLDDENSSEPLIYGRRMQFGAQTSGSTGAIVVKLSKVRLVFDDTSIHFGRTNALYADGHVIYH